MPVGFNAPNCSCGGDSDFLVLDFDVDRASVSHSKDSQDDDARKLHRDEWKLLFLCTFTKNKKYAYVDFDEMFVFELGMDAQVAPCIPCPRVSI